MPFIAPHRLKPDEIDAALVLYDTLLMARLFWADDLTIPNNRPDLPAAWAGKQVLSKEQRIMFLAGCEYMLLRDVIPEASFWSPARLALRTSRKVAKTVGFEVRWIQIPLCKTGSGMQEGFIHTPGDAHLAPTQERVTRRIAATPLFSMLEKGFDKTNGIQVWKNGFAWQIRVEGKAQGAKEAGRSQVGVRATHMLGDEADFSDGAAWEQREQSALPGAYSYEGGVPRGFRGKFWRIANTSEGKNWFTFRCDMRTNPLYHSKRAWDEQVAGNYYSQRVQTQVLGLDGEEAITSFPVIPIDHQAPYRQLSFSNKEYEQHQVDLRSFLELPTRAMACREAEAWLVIMDYGYAPSPCEIGVLYRKAGIWRMLGRYEMLHMDQYPTAHVLHCLDTQVLPQRADALVIDAHGAGSGVLSVLQKNENWLELDYTTRVMDAGFAGTVRIPGVLSHKKCRTIVADTGMRDGMWTCPKCNLTIWSRDELSDAMIPTKTWLMTRLKELFVYGERSLRDQTGQWPAADALVLGPDEAIAEELAGTTEIQLANSVRVVTATGRDHLLDMLLAGAQAIARWTENQAKEKNVSVSEFGWIGGDSGVSGWTPPWERS
jgi:hypothetical protein